MVSVKTINLRRLRVISALLTDAMGGIMTFIHEELLVSTVECWPCWFFITSSKVVLLNMSTCKECQCTWWAMLFWSHGIQVYFQWKLSTLRQVIPPAGCACLIHSWDYLAVLFWSYCVWCARSISYWYLAIGLGSPIISIKTRMLAMPAACHVRVADCMLHFIVADGMLLNLNPQKQGPSFPFSLVSGNNAAAST